MPCRGDYREDEDRSNTLTRLLCEAMKVIQERGLLQDCSVNLRAWKSSHDIEDERRQLAEEERRRKQAEEKARQEERDRVIAALSPEQRQILGLK